MTEPLEPRWACRRCDNPVHQSTGDPTVWFHDPDGPGPPHEIEPYDARAIPYAIGSYVLPGLSKLNEECGEAVQVIGKLLATGGARRHWSGDLHEMLVEEVSDVLAAAMFYRDVAMSDEHATATSIRTGQKYELFHEWHRNGDPPPAADPIAYCGVDVGERPSWMGVDQYDPCRCRLLKGHDGDHKCKHDLEDTTR